MTNPQGKLTLKNPNGTALDCTYIPDVWNLSEWLSEGDMTVVDPTDPRKKINAGDAVSTLWGQTHNMKTEIQRLHAKYPHEAFIFSEYVPEWERPYVLRLIQMCLVGGNTITVFDGEENSIEDSQDINAILLELGAAEEDRLHITDSEGDYLGWFYLIYNNGSEQDPEIVVCDYNDTPFCNKVVTSDYVMKGIHNCDSCLDNTDIDCHDCEQYQYARPETYKWAK